MGGRSEEKRKERRRKEGGKLGQPLIFIGASDLSGILLGASPCAASIPHMFYQVSSLKHLTFKFLRLIWFSKAI